MIILLAALAAKGASWVLTPGGLGPVRIGMTMRQVSRALGEQLVGQAIEDEAYCVEKSSSKGPRGVNYMFENGRLTRISVFEVPSVKTPRGITIGSSEAEVRKAYGAALKSEPHTYIEAPAAYLTYWLGESRGVRFEMDAKRRVDIIHAGLNSISYVEGCA